MDWKNQLTKTPYLVLFIVLITIGVGTASALITITLSGDVIITDDLLVEGQTNVMGPIISHRPSGNSANVVIERPGGPTSDNTQFVFSHRSTNKDLWLYANDGTTFKNFVGFDYPNYKVTFPSTGDTLVVDAANDKVGIGTSSPSSELEVIGNVAISGNLDVDGFTAHPTVYRVLDIGSFPGNGVGQRDAFCDTGDTVVGGGIFSIYLEIFVLDSYPLSSPDGWKIKASNEEGVSRDATIVAICLDTANPPHIDP